jgi:hypothetical protein
MKGDGRWRVTPHLLYKKEDGVFGYYFSLCLSPIGNTALLRGVLLDELIGVSFLHHTHPTTIASSHFSGEEQIVFWENEVLVSLQVSAARPAQPAAQPEVPAGSPASRFLTDAKAERSFGAQPETAGSQPKFPAVAPASRFLSRL